MCKAMSFRFFRTIFTLAALGIALLQAIQARSAHAGEATVAVATNFLLPAREIVAAFEAETGSSVTLVAGSSGKLAAQIIAGAPFDVFLSADETRVVQLIERDAAVADTRFTYAVGRLVLWSPGPLPLKDGTLASLDVDAVGRLAIANPKLAPYGLAAEQTLAALGLLETLKDRLVFGENVGQTFALAASGNVTAAFVAASQVATLKPGEAGHAAPVPDDMHDPIRQDGVLTARGAGNQAARAFLGFMKGPAAGGVIARYGYGKASE
jgi:molybdate transport system substrate-binding protein